MTTLNDWSLSFLQEWEFFERKLFDLGKDFGKNRDLDWHPSSNILTLVMVHKPVIVKEEPWILKLVVIEFLIRINPLLLHFFIFVALIEPSRFNSMFHPASHTQPTKLVFAQLTSHMVTSLILFNWPLAFRAFLSASFNPPFRFTHTWVLLFPFVCYFTWTRFMFFIATCKAKRTSTLTNSFSFPLVLRLNTKLTTWERTPFHIFVIICKGTTSKFLVS